MKYYNPKGPKFSMHAQDVVNGMNNYKWFTNHSIMSQVLEYNKLGGFKYKATTLKPRVFNE